MKKQKKDEITDINMLPNINIVTTSVILDFKNQDRRFKILENMYKNPEKILKILSREQIIEFAKENKIYIDPEENKKVNPKEPQIEKREINSEELAKAAVGLIQNRSIPIRQEKKAFFEKIEELKKQKEEAIMLRDNPPPVDPKSRPKPGDKKKLEIQINPDDIIIPVIDEYAAEMIVVFYNYPLREGEYLALEKEKITLNHLYLIKELDELVEEKKEDNVTIDKSGKPIKGQATAKEVKASNNDLIQMHKYFALLPIESESIFKELLSARRKSAKNSLLRMTFFEKIDFSYKEANDENKKDSLALIQEEIIEKMTKINKQYLYYLKWLANTFFQSFSEEDIKLFSTNNVAEIMNKSPTEKKEFERFSTGAILFSFCLDLINFLRNKTNLKEEEKIKNEIIYENNNIDDLFESIEREIGQEHSNKNQNETEKNINLKNDLGVDTQPRLSHIQSDRQKELEKVENRMMTSDDLSSPFKLIIDENDFILKSSMDNKFENLSIAEKEKMLNIFRLFPGIARYLMPSLPPIEENRRKALKCEIYPFLVEGINIPIYEKYEIIKKFEEIFKQKLPEHNFDFGDRIYQEVMTRDILTQVLNNFLMYDPEILTEYNPRDDNMLVAIYYRCPVGRVYRKTNKYRYLSKPDFENWVKFFRPTFTSSGSDNQKINTPVNNNLNGHNSLNYINNQINRPTRLIASPRADNKLHNVQPNNTNSHQSGDKFNFNFQKINLDKSALILNIPYDPKENVLYDADDTFVGEVTEKIKYMFPTDNGVFIKKVVENGIFSSFSSYVIKDHLMFGIRKNANNISEFWLRFENDVLMTCNYIGNYNPYIEGHDAEPVHDNMNGTFTTFSFKDGLNVQIMPNGDICQKRIEATDENNLENEMHRVITSKASVIKYMPLDIINIMYANGNICKIQGGLATNTNNKGLRVVKDLKDGKEYELHPPTFVTIQTDPESNTKTMIREDKVINIKYPDNSCLTIHPDDTKIYTYPDNLRFLIEHDNYASVDISYDPIKKRTKSVISEGSSDAILGNDNLMRRSYDGRLSKVILPDKTIVYTFKEKKMTDLIDKFTFNTVTIIYRVDGTVIRVQQDGDIVLVTSQERYNLNSKGQNLDFSRSLDIDYYFDLNGNPKDRNPGIYTANLKNSKIWTKDHENNIFQIDSDGIAKSKLSITLHLEHLISDIDDIPPQSPRYETNDYIDPLDLSLKPPSNFFPPKLFVISNDNTGYELLSENQIFNFKILKGKDINHTKYIKQPVEEYFTSHYWITRHQSIQELIKETQSIKNIKIPKYLEKITHTPNKQNYPHDEIYLYRNLIESAQITPEFREKVALSIKNKDEWYAKRKVEFGSMEGSAFMEELKENILIQKRILEERQTPDVKFEYDKMQLLINTHNVKIDTKDNTSILLDIDEYVHEKEKKKIIEDNAFRNRPLCFDRQENDNYAVSKVSDNSHKKRKTKIFDVKAMQEIKFVNYFDSEEGKNLIQMNPQISKIKKASDNYERKKVGYLEENDDQSNEKQFNPNSMEAILEIINSKNNFDLNPENFTPKQISPIVYLNEDKNLKGKGAKENFSILKKNLLPSLYKTNVEKLKDKSEKEKQEAEKYVKLKNYDYSYDGSPRKSNPNIPSYLKTTFPEAVFNEDYLYVDKLTDRRIKTSSVSRRLYFNAPSVNAIRKSGQHNFLLEAIEKRKTYEEMMERLNLMVTSELCDPLNKMLKIDPTELNFGYLKSGERYQMVFTLRNDDNMTNRVQIRRNMECKFLDIEMFVGGKIPPGDIKTVKIILEADTKILGKFSEVIEVQTKSFIYKIPVQAHIVLNSEYVKLSEKNKKITFAECYKKIPSLIEKKSKSKDKKKMKSKMNLPIYEQLPHLFDTSKIQKYLKIMQKESDFNIEYEEEKTNNPPVV